MLGLILPLLLLEINFGIIPVTTKTVPSGHHREKPTWEPFRLPELFFEDTFWNPFAFPGDIQNKRFDNYFEKDRSPGMKIFKYEYQKPVFAKNETNLIVSKDKGTKAFPTPLNPRENMMTDGSKVSPRPYVEKSTWKPLLPFWNPFAFPGEVQNKRGKHSEKDRYFSPVMKIFKLDHQKPIFAKNKNNLSEPKSKEMESFPTPRNPKENMMVVSGKSGGHLDLNEHHEAANGTLDCYRNGIFYIWTIDWPTIAVHLCIITLSTAVITVGVMLYRSCVHVERRMKVKVMQKSMPFQV